MKLSQYILPILFLTVAFNCTPKETSKTKLVKTGAQVLIQEHLPELKGKRVGLFMNPTARIEGVHVLDTLLALDVDVTDLFAPEHGFRGDAGAGETIKSGIDSASGLPVHSLYSGGKILKPSPEVLNNLDIILFDMQDVGARFYTYNVSMKLLLEAVAETGTEVWILDRPNPAGGEYVSGWILEDKYRSFVGDYPIPIAHGLTLGELALMAVGESWLDTIKPVNLKIIEMEGWKRSYKWPDTGLNWFPPSPNLPAFENAYVYLGTCFIEGTSLSEGRGTDNPFLILGAPNTKVQLKDLAEIGVKYGVKLDTVSFTPKSIPGKSLNPKHKDSKSFGVKIVSMSTNEKSLEDPVKFGIELMYLLMDATPKAEYKSFIKKLSGTDKILNKQELDSWGKSFENYVTTRKAYLIYD